MVWFLEGLLVFTTGLDGLRLSGFQGGSIFHNPEAQLPAPSLEHNEASNVAPVL